MSQTLTAQLNMNLSATLTDTANVLNTITSVINSGSGSLTALDHTLSNDSGGHGANTANKLFFQEYTIANSASQSLTLTSLTDRFGAALSFTKIRAVLIRIVSPVTGGTLLYGNGSQPWQAWLSTAANTFSIGDLFFHINGVDGWTVNSGDVLKLANSSGASITVDVILIGY